MAAPAPYTAGLDERIHVQLEGAYAEALTTAVPLAADAIRHLRAVVISADDPRSPREDRKGTRSRLERIIGKRAGTWSIRKYLLPNGVIDTPPGRSIPLARRPRGRGRIAK